MRPWPVAGSFFVISLILTSMPGAGAASMVLPAAGLDALRKSMGEGWTSGTDRYGEVTYVRIATDAAKDVRIVDSGTRH